MRNIFTINPLQGAFIVSILCAAQYSQAQTVLIDTAQPEILVKHAMELYLQVEYDSSIIYLQKASKIFHEENKWERYVHCLNIIADCLSRKVALDSMELVLHQARNIEEERLEPDNLECALTYSIAGILDIYRDKFDVAIENIKRGKTIRENKLGRSDRLVAASDYLLGTAYAHQGNLDQAIVLFNEALAIYTRLDDNDHFNLSLTLLGIGYVSFLKSDFDIALDHFVRAYSLVNNGDKKYLSAAADCQQFLGWTYSEKGENQQAIIHLTNAVNLYRNIFGEDNIFLAGCYSRLGRLHQAEGDCEKAIQFYQKALSLETKYVGRNHSFVALEKRQLGSVYENKNDLVNAIHFSKDALALQRKTKGDNHPELAYTYEILGNIYKKRGEFILSLKLLQKALRIRSCLKESYDRNDIPNLYTEIGSVYLEMKKFDRALKYYNKALLLYNNLPEPNRPQRAAALKGLGDVYLCLKDLRSSLKYYQQAIIAFSSEPTDSSIYVNPKEGDSPNSRDLVEILSAKAVALEKYYFHKSHALRDLQAALSTYECAVHLLNRLRKNIATEGSKLLLGEQSHYMYQNAARVSLRLYKATGKPCYKESAFYFAENSKANVLLDGLHDSEAKKFSNIPDSLIDKERLLKIDIAYNENQLQRENDKNEKRDSAKILSLQDKCFMLNNDALKLSTIFENEYPLYYELKYKSHSATIDEVQNAIDEKTGVIEYFIGRNSLAIFIITKSSFDVVTVQIPKNFSQLTSTFYKAIKTVEGSDYVRSGCALYDLLFRPLRNKLAGKSRLVIIPDGFLYYLPFEALITRPPRKTNEVLDFTKLDYLLKSYEISYSYSSSFYIDRLRQNGTETGNDFSFVGFAPVFRDVDSNRIFLPNFSLLNKDPIAFRSVTIDGKRFDELKYSGQEVSSVAETFQHKGKLGDSFLYNSATEENFKMNVGKYSCVHIATHGYINEEHPQLSMLLFSQPRDTSTREDGVLYASETYNLTLNADLLVLSSCESGLGKLVKGEGVIAMTRGFFYSGAHNIIFTLWKVLDKQTNKLMVEFYSHVLEGDSFSSALRKSKLRLIMDQSTAFPSKWSGFILVGK
ncbi:MAG: CHAT domain-containing tetratricopeptide repeat protein [Bacteroidota bacterium]